MKVKCGRVLGKRKMRSRIR